MIHETACTCLENYLFLQSHVGVLNLFSILQVKFWLILNIIVKEN